jgi:DNA-binding response OmpR family regulator
VRILIVEDERKLAQVLVTALQGEHYETVVAPTGNEGFLRANAEAFDLVVLDLMLPGRNGLEILQTLRQRHLQTPVLILTARDGLEDRVMHRANARPCLCGFVMKLDLYREKGEPSEYLRRS